MQPKENFTVTGIDFGSSALKVAAILKGGVQVITNEANFRQTPNVVGLGQNERLIGEAGQAKIKSNFRNSVIAPNRFLGYEVSTEGGNQYLEKELEFCPSGSNFAKATAKIDEENNTNSGENQLSSQNSKETLKFNLLYNQERENFTSEQLVAAMVTEIEKIISHTNKLSNKNMVIALPSYMTQHERSAFVDAMQIANKKLSHQTGHSYSFQFVEEQIATCMDYGFGKRNEFSDKLEEAKNVLFIDVGHSKTSAYVGSFNKQHFRIVANEFNRQLGCKFMDRELLRFYAEKFDEMNGSQCDLKLMESKKAVLKLLDSIEKQRKVLTGINEHDLSIECLLEDCDINYTMKREEYEQICESVSEKLRTLLGNLERQIQEKGIKFDHIELVGGGSRVPFVIQLIKETFKQQPQRTINSNECIARGAALVSAMNSAIFKVPNYSYFGMSNYKVELLINGKEYQMGNLLERNEIKLVSGKTIEICLPEVEMSGEMEILARYGEDIESGLNRNIFSVIALVNKQPNANAKTSSSVEPMSDENSEMNMESQSYEDQNSEMQIAKLELTFGFDSYGRIEFRELKSGNGFDVKVLRVEKYGKFTQEELSQMEQKQKEMTLKDLALKQFYEKKNEYEALIYKNRDKIERFFSENYEYVDPEVQSQMKNYLTEEENSLYADVGDEEQLKKSNFDKKTKEMNTKIETTIKSITEIKKQHQGIKGEIEVLYKSLDDIVKRYQKDQYPEEVSQGYEWIVDIAKKYEESNKWEQPIVSQKQLKDVTEAVQQAFQRFENQKRRQQHPYNTRHNGGYQRQQPQYDEYPYGQQQQGGFFRNGSGYGGYERQTRPRTTRNSQNSGFGGSGMFNDFFGGRGAFGGGFF